MSNRSVRVTSPKTARPSTVRKKIPANALVHTPRPEPRRLALEIAARIRQNHRGASASTRVVARIALNGVVVAIGPNDVAAVTVIQMVITARQQ